MDEHKEKKHKKDSTEMIILSIAVILGIFLLVTNITIFNVNSNLDKKTKEIQEKSKPALIELMIVKNSKCTDCFDISSVIETIKGTNANVTKETTVEFNTNEAKSLISKYQLKKIPTVVVTGELDKFQLEGLEKIDGALIFSEVPAPYTNAGSGKIEGLVKLYYLKDPTCTQCTELDSLIEQIKVAGLKIYDKVIVDPSSSQGQQLVDKYKISMAPSIILSKEASAYSIITEAWPQVGSVEQDGSFVLRIPYPPFRNLTTKEVKGVVNAIYLIDISCKECYDANQHKGILASPQSYNIKFGTEENVDVSSQKGKDILAKYNITLVPTIILSKDVAVYPGSNSLKQFFSVEQDGSYVFTKLDAVGIHKDLVTGKIVNVSSEQQV